MTHSPKEPTLSTFQKVFTLSRNVSVFPVFFYSIAHGMGTSKASEHENYCSIEMGQFLLLSTFNSKEAVELINVK